MNPPAFPRPPHSSPPPSPTGRRSSGTAHDTTGRRWRGWTLTALLGSALLAGCMPPPSMPRYAIPPIGARCTIQFQRDALGAGAALPIPPTTGSINGAATSVSGILRQFTTEWIVLDADGRELWIPKGVVLLIEVEAATSRTPEGNR